MKRFTQSLFWFKTVVAYLLAFSFLAFCIALPLGMTGFLSGYIGWPIVIGLFVSSLDKNAKDALKTWVLTPGGSTDHMKDGDENYVL